MISRKSALLAYVDGLRDKVERDEITSMSVSRTTEFYGQQQVLGWTFRVDYFEPHIEVPKVQPDYIELFL